MHVSGIIPMVKMPGYICCLITKFPLLYAPISNKTVTYPQTSSVYKKVRFRTLQLSINTLIGTIQ